MALVGRSQITLGDVTDANVTIVRKSSLTKSGRLEVLVLVRGACQGAFHHGGSHNDRSAAETAPPLPRQWLRILTRITVSFELRCLPMVSRWPAVPHGWA